MPGTAPPGIAGGHPALAFAFGENRSTEMKSRRERMTPEEFHRLPMEPGWKIEYIDGIAVWTARPAGVKTVLTLTALPPVDCRAALRPVTDADAAALIDLYAAAFADTIEYCDCGPEYIRGQAEIGITRFFAGTEGAPLADASSIAAAPETGTPAGAILVREGRRGRPVSELLFVAPAWHRRRVGRALMTHAVNQLVAAGRAELVTGYALGNHAAMQFYHRFGFIDAPSEAVARILWQCAARELSRRPLEELSEPDRIRLTDERDRRERIVRHWESLPPGERWRDRGE